MRVVMLTPQVDQSGWVTGFIHSWVRTLAEHPQVDALDVICLEMGDHDLPDNVTVHSMGKERGYSRLREMMALQSALLKTIAKADIIFGHMIPRFTLAAAPLALLTATPMVQWYTHRQVGTELRIVHRLVKQIVTASEESFRLPSNKVTVLGHGIDTEQFHPQLKQPHEGRVILAVGRLSPIKHYEALIAGVGELIKRGGYEDVRVIIAGGTTPEHGEAYQTSLEELAREAGISDRVYFRGAVPHRDIPSLFAEADVTVNLCPTGGVDKAVIESMASGIPAIVRNETFIPLLGEERGVLWCPSLDADQVADRIGAIVAQSIEDRDTLGLELRERMQENYALEGFIHRLVEVFQQVIATS